MGLFKTASGSTALHYSAPVVVNSVEFNANSRTIMAFCADGNVRKCRIDNCANVEFARALFRVVKAFAVTGNPLTFCSMGNNSPDKWFFNADRPVEEVKDDLSLAAYMEG